MALPGGRQTHDPRRAESALDVPVVMTDEAEGGVELSKDPVDVHTPDVVVLAGHDTVGCLVYQEDVDVGEVEDPFDVLVGEVSSPIARQLRSITVIPRGGVVPG